jgi:membrane-associated phospholipid phosphatase
MGAMLLATPMVGGHYLIDIFAGIAVAIGAIAAARWTSKRVLAARPRTVASPGETSAPERAKTAPAFTPLETSLKT